MRGRATYPKKETREDVFARLQARAREDADPIPASSRMGAEVPLVLAGADPMRVLRERLDREEYAA
jgi:hypothetical protein